MSVMCGDSRGSMAEIPHLQRVADAIIPAFTPDMSDPLRTDPSQPNDGSSEAERTAKIEQLLLAGLDHYFVAEYEQAINVWTRALFLDRGHARARAYIERARAALAERQRQSEDLLHDGLAAFQRGDGPEARRLLRTALTNGAPSEVALAVLDRLDRLEQSTGQVPVPDVIDRPAVPEAAARAKGGSSSTRWAMLLLAVAAVGAVAVAVRAPWRTWWPVAAAPAASPLAASRSVLPLPRRGETALSRARSLVARGHLHEALGELEAVKTTDPERSDADRLRSDLQRQLIALTLPSADARSKPHP